MVFQVQCKAAWSQSPIVTCLPKLWEVGLFGGVERAIKKWRTVGIIFTFIRQLDLPVPIVHQRTVALILCELTFAQNIVIYASTATLSRTSGAIPRGRRLLKITTNSHLIFLTRILIPPPNPKSFLLHTKNIYFCYSLCTFNFVFWKQKRN